MPTYSLLPCIEARMCARVHDARAGSLRPTALVAYASVARRMLMNTIARLSTLAAADEEGDEDEGDEDDGGECHVVAHSWPRRADRRAARSD